MCVREGAHGRGAALAVRPVCSQLLSRGPGGNDILLPSLEVKFPVGAFNQTQTTRGAPPGKLSVVQIPGLERPGHPHVFRALQVVVTGLWFAAPRSQHLVEL